MNEQRTSNRDTSTEQIKKLAIEEIREVLDAEVLNPLLDLINAFEAGIATFKHHISNSKGLIENRWNPEKIKWEPAEGKSGTYERSEDINNPQFKAMLKDLAAHGGKLTRKGWFYWIFKNGSTVGRKKRG